MTFFEKVFEVPTEIKISNDSSDPSFTEGLFSKSDQFAAAFATIPNLDYNLFLNVLMFFEQVEKFDCYRNLHHAMSHPQDNWSNVRGFVDRDPGELFDILGRSRNPSNSDSFRAAGVELFRSGSQRLELDGENWENSDNSDRLNKVLSDVKMVMSSALIEKKNAMTNVVASLTSVLPMKESPADTLRDKYDKVVEMIDRFDSGTFDYSLTKMVKFPKECGVTLPHTMTPKQWIAKALHGLLCDVTDGQAGVAFKMNGKVEISRVQHPGDVIYFSDDEDSPYRLDRHPSWTIDGLNDSEWEWRELERMERKRVDVDYVEYSLLEKQQVLENLLRQTLVDRDLAVELQFVERFPFMFIKDGVPYFKFYSDGISNLSDVTNNSGFLHLVSVNVISQISDSEYAKILLPDTNTVVLIPFEFWAVLQIESFQTTSGIAVQSNLDLSAMRNVTICYHLSHSMAFLRSLGGGKPYVFHEHAEHLEKMIVARGANRVLFEEGASSESKVRLLKGLSKLTVGGCHGLVISACRSKVGDRTSEKLNRNASYTKVLSAKFGRKNSKVSFIEALKANVNSGKDEKNQDEEGLSGEGLSAETLKNMKKLMNEDL